MPRLRIYKAEFLDKEGKVLYDTTFQAMTQKEGMQKAFDYKFYKLPYGSGKLKTVLTIIGKL
jgi:hypothetical protein